MAENPTTTAERDRLRGPIVDDPVMPDAQRYEPTDSPTGVDVYDRPATARPATSNMFSTILAILVVLILAYFVFQWLF